MNNLEGVGTEGTHRRSHLLHFYREISLWNYFTTMLGANKLSPLKEYTVYLKGNQHIRRELEAFN